MNAVTMLEQQREVEKLFKELEAATSAGPRSKVFKRVIADL
jgi:hypothetical protein